MTENADAKCLGVIQNIISGIDEKASDKLFCRILFYLHGPQSKKKWVTKGPVKQALAGGRGHWQ